MEKGDFVKPIFPKWTNKLPLLLGLGIPVLLALVVFFIWYYFSPKYLAEGYQPQQPVMFSHKLHAGQLGLDCRYCHSTVEKTAFAALPTTSVCMGCHNKVLPNSPLIAPVKESYEKHKPIEWVRVHALPRHAHFDHSAHVTAGVGCATCHNRVDTMDVVYQAAPLSMGWCLECHRNPAPNLRPQSEITNMLYDPVASNYHPFADADRKQNIIQPPESCGACHY